MPAPHFVSVTFSKNRTNAGMTRSGDRAPTVGTCSRMDSSRVRGVRRLPYNSSWLSGIFVAASNPGSRVFPTWRMPSQASIEL
eukprot:4050207-Heterocapsa_arctica.AAC.1